jgi:two-component system cell cycle sensor histidine kinase/response regulator CckA
MSRQEHDVSGALAESEEKYRTLIENLDTGLVLLDENLRVVEFHDTFTGILGFDPGQVLGRSLEELHPRGAPVSERILEALHRILDTGDTLRLQGQRLPIADGTASHEIHMDLSIFRVILSGRRYVACSFQDVTDRHRLQEQLLQAQKMESIGRLASGLAHDFNNLLAGIMGNASLLEIEAGDPDEVRAAATQIKEAARRAADLSGRMMTFSRKRPPRREALDMAAVVGSVARLLGTARPPGIEIEVDVADDLPVIEADRTQLETALLNLLLNAVDAMPGGGTVCVSAREIVVDQWKPGTNPAVGEGRWLRLTVSDTGTGMDEQTRSRVFEPFFTTKDPGKGTGLGLYTVYGIVQAHEGQISVGSEPGQGTSFDLYFPLGRGGDAAPARASIGPPLPGHGTILIVDDEEIIRNTLSSMLSRLGYRTLLARSGSEALEILAGEPGVELVLLDLVMEGLDGRETFQRIRRMHEPPHVLLMSGTVEQAEVDGLIQSGARGFLPKPFSLNRLSRSVRFALRG